MSTKEIGNDELVLFLHPVKSIQDLISNVLVQLKRGELKGSNTRAKKTMEILRAVLRECNFSSFDQMIKIIRLIGQELLNVAPCEFIIGNIVKRILFLVREEYDQKKRTLESGSSSHQSCEKPSSDVPNVSKIYHEKSCDDILTLFAPTPFAQLARESHSNSANISSPMLEEDNSFESMFSDLRQAILSSIAEMIDEMDAMNVHISEQAEEHIHADECILTHGYSYLVESFFKAAAKKRHFQVIVMEDSPSLSGHKLANNLSKYSNITVTLIPDSNVYAIMSRINKVILSPHAIMANGGAFCDAGQGMIAIAAKEFSVPVLGVAVNLTFTPLFPHNQSVAMHQQCSPADLSPPVFTALDCLEDGSHQVTVELPRYDYIAPESWDLFVTNNGCHLPSYVYRLLSEFYHPSDYQF